MRAIFAHDHRFVLADGDVWSNQFSTAVWQRYTRFFERLTVTARFGSPPHKPTAQLVPCGSSVAFEFFPDLSSISGLTVARPAAFRRMAKLVATHDAVIARLPSEIGLLAISAARAAQKPWAVEVVGCPWDGLRNYGTLKGIAYAPVARWRMAKAVANAKNAIFVTKSFLQERYPTAARNTASVSNVVLSEISKTVLHARTERIESTWGSEVRLGMIASLQVRFKGIHTALAALASLRNDLPLLSLHVLGGGDASPWREEAAKKGVADIVHFEGTLPAGQPVFEWLDRIDVYLQPSLQEGLPRALIEAMSRGCPAIASTVAGIPELLPREDLITPGDARALAEIIKRRMGDREWFQNRARRNWHEAQGFSAELLDARRDAFWAKFKAEAAELGHFSG